LIRSAIDDQRQRSFVTGYRDLPPGSPEHDDIRSRYIQAPFDHAGGYQRTLPRRLITERDWRCLPAGDESTQIADSVPSSKLP